MQRIVVDGIEIIVAGNDYASLCHDLIARYHLQMVILTCGISGSYVFSEHEESFLPTPKVDVVDTVGARDSFTRAFVANILQGSSIREAHVMTVQISAYVCTQSGAMLTMDDFVVEESGKIE